MNYALNVLWLERNIGMAVDQVFGEVSTHLQPVFEPLYDGASRLCTSYMCLADCWPMQGQAGACRCPCAQQCRDVAAVLHTAGWLLAPVLCCRQETVMQTVSSAVGSAVAMLHLYMLLLPSLELPGAAHIKQK